MAKQGIDIEIGVKGEERALSALEKIAKKARELRREDSLSGEKALGSVLGGGAQGIAGFAFSALGKGLEATLVDAVGRSLASFSGKFIEMRKAMGEGKLDGVQAAEGIIGEAPLLGGFFKFFRDAREIVTGTKQKFEEEQALDKAGEQLADARSKFIAAMLSNQRDLAQKIYADRAAANIASLFLNPVAQLGASSNEAIRLAMQDAQNKKEKARGSIDDAATPQRQAASAAINLLNQQLEAAMGRDSANTEANGGYRNSADESDKRAVDAARQRVQEALAARDDAEKTIREAKGKSDAQLEADLAETLRKLGYTRAQAEKRLQDDITERFRRGREEMLDVQSQTQAAALRRAGEYWAADKLLADRAHEAKIAALRKQAKEDVEAGADPRARGQLLDSQIRTENQSYQFKLVETSDALRERYRTAVAEVRAKAMDYSGNAYGAAKERITAAGIGRMRDAQSEAERNAIAQSTAYDIAGLSTGNSFSGRTASATSRADRFSTGATDAILTRTAAVDTSKHTKDLLTAFKEFMSEWKRSKDSEGAALGPIGNNN